MNKENINVHSEIPSENLDRTMGFSQTNNVSLSNADRKDLSSMKKKKLTERVGDWVCIKCKNLNFSFRIICNRCELPKTENDLLYEKYCNNMMNMNKIHELFNRQNLYNQNYANFINNQCMTQNSFKPMYYGQQIPMSMSNSVNVNPYYGNINMVPSQVNMNQMKMPYGVMNNQNQNLRGNVNGGFVNPNNYYK